MSHADSKAQPAPTGDGQPVLVEVIHDLVTRRAHGVQKYGVELKAGNGRKPLADLYQELLDAVMYTKQELMERDGSLPNSKRELGVIASALNLYYSRSEPEAIDSSFGIFKDDGIPIARPEVEALFYKVRDLYRAG